MQKLLRRFGLWKNYYRYGRGPLFWIGRVFVQKRLKYNLLGCIRNVVSALDLRTETDQELLRRFASAGDEAAFTAIVRRHGPMVMRVAVRTLQNEHDAEDVFQATFLVLSQKSHSLRRQGSLGSWLYGIAYRIALKAKATAGGRRNREQRATPTPVPGPLAQITVQEAQTILDEELHRLPEQLREPVVLCCLEGLARDEAAHRIGCSAGVLKSRLERGRERLRLRLVARGLTLPCGFGAFLLLECAAEAAVPPALIASTTKAAINVAAGKAVSTVATAKVAALTEGVLKAMMITKLKAVVSVVLVLGFLVTGATVLSYRTAAAQSEPPPAATETKAPQNEQPSKASPQAPQPKEKTDLDKLQGTWEVTTFQVRGIDVEGPIADQFKAIKFIFKGNQLTYDGKGEDGNAPPPQRIKLDPKKDPKHIDLTPLDAKLKTTEGLYDIQNDELRLCLAQNEERPKAMASNKDTRDVFLILKRIAPKGKKDGEKAKEDGRKKPLAKHDFTNLQRLASALENFNYPENAATTITVWCQGGGKGTSAQITDAKALDAAAACHMIVDGHHDKKALDLENVAIVSADGSLVRFVNIKEKLAANKASGILVNRGDLVVVLQLRND